MNKNEIQKRNKQIALMLGWEQYQDPEERWFGHWKPNTTLEKPWSIRVERLEFDSDWNWLMEVVEFIESIKLDNFGYIVEMLPSTSRIYNARNNYTVVWGDPKTSRKESTFVVVSDFAKHYNENKIGG